MATTKTATTPKTTDHLSSVLELLASGADLAQIQAEAQAKAIRDAALGPEGNGIITVTINKSMSVQDSNGTRTVLSSYFSHEGCKAQDGNPLGPYLEKVMEMTGGELEVVLTISESFADKLADKRQDYGNLKVEVVANGPCEFRQVQARFSKDHPDMACRTKPIFLLQKEGSPTDPGNWTVENTGIPLMKLRLRVGIQQALSWGAAPNRVAPMPGLDDLLNLARNSAAVQSYNLSNWTSARTAEREVANQQQEKASEEAAGLAAGIASMVR